MRHLLHASIESLRAEETYALVEAVALAVSPDKSGERSDRLARIATLAFEDDEARLAQELERIAMTR